MNLRLSRQREARLTVEAQERANLKPAQPGALLHLPAIEIAHIQAAARAYGVDPALLAAIRVAEGGGPGREMGLVNENFVRPFRARYGTAAQYYAAAANLRTARYDHNLKSQRGRPDIAAIGAVWAPVGASNDPNGLNKNWVANVSAAYEWFSRQKALAAQSGTRAQRKAVAVPNGRRATYEQMSTTFRNTMMGETVRAGRKSVSDAVAALVAEYRAYGGSNADLLRAVLLNYREPRTGNSLSEDLVSRLVANFGTNR